MDGSASKMLFIFCELLNKGLILEEEQKAMKSKSITYFVQYLTFFCVMHD